MRRGPCESPPAHASNVSAVEGIRTPPTLIKSLDRFQNFPFYLCAAPSLIRFQPCCLVLLSASISELRPRFPLLRSNHWRWQQTLGVPWKIRTVSILQPCCCWRQLIISFRCCCRPGARCVVTFRDVNKHDSSYRWPSDIVSCKELELSYKSRSQLSN